MRSNRAVPDLELTGMGAFEVRFGDFRSAGCAENNRSQPLFQLILVCKWLSEAALRKKRGVFQRASFDGTRWRQWKCARPSEEVAAISIGAIISSVVFISWKGRRGQLTGRPGDRGDRGVRLRVATPGERSGVSPLKRCREQRKSKQSVRDAHTSINSR